MTRVFSRRLSLRGKLLCAFSALVVLLGLVGAVSSVGLANLRDRTEAVALGAAPNLQYAENASLQLSLIRESLLSALMATAPTQRQYEIQEETNAADRFQADLQKLIAAQDDPAENDAVQTISAEWPGVRRIVDDVVALQASGDPAAARALSVGLETQADRLDVSLYALIEHEHALTDLENQDAANSFTWTELAIALVAVVATILGIVAAFLIAAPVSATVRELARAARAVASGDLNARAAVQSGDELEALAHDFNSMALSLEQQRQVIAEASAESHRLAALVIAMDDAIVGTSPDATVTSWNPGAERLYGYSAEEMIGSTLAVVMAEDRPGELPAYLARVVRGERIEYFETQRRHKSGRIIDVSVSIAPVFDGDGAVVGTVSVARDVTEQRQAARALARQALHDGLTGLANRAGLQVELEQLVGNAESTQGSPALVLLDLNRFQDVNDTLGHEAGDLLLWELARRIETMCEQVGDSAMKLVVISRLGGDEYAVLVEGASAATAEALGRRILQAIDTPFELEGQPIVLEASVGIALLEQDASDGTTLLRHADIALHDAKARDTDLCIYAAEEHKHEPERLKLLGELRTAIERDELVLYYQPKLELATGRLVGVEALVRWQHPVRGLTPPAHFLPIAEQTNLIEPLTDWVLDAALRQQRAWRKDGLETPVAVNLSRRSLQNPQLTSKVAAQLDKHGVPPSALQLEITETSLESDTARAAATLAGLREIGVTISIDDFGTGYSSLASLEVLPIDELKIDRSLVRDMATESGARSIIRAIVDMADDLGLHAVAEGIEDRATWDVLARIGCGIGQGYHISPPLPADELAQWAAELTNSPVAAVDPTELETLQAERTRRRGERLSAEHEFLARKAAEAALRENEERFRRQYKGIPVPTYTWRSADGDFVLEDYNDAADAITHGGVAGWLGTRASERYADMPEIAADLHACVAEGGTVQREMSYTYRTTGRERRLSLTYVFVPPETVMLHTEDVTERYEAEQQREVLARSEKLRALGQMASGVAHDLNQRLMMIASYGELASRALTDGTLDVDEAREMCAVATQAALDGGETVKRLLRFTRSGAERAIERVQLVEVAQEVVQLTAPRWRRAARSGGAVSVYVEAVDRPAILGSAGSVQEVLTNLIFNAVDAMPNGGPIRLVIRQQGTHAIVEVVDSGVGMPPEVQARLFEPFFTTKGESGTGLGLATVFGIVEGLGGRIEVQSTPGAGTTFRVTLPLAPAIVEPLPVPTEEAPPAPRQLRILAVDDEPGITRAVARLLRPTGHVVQTASSGEEALEVLQKDTFDVVLSDLGMPGMDGWELAEHVQQRWPHIRFVLATGWGASIDASEASAMGVASVLAKPYRMEDLEHALAA